LSYGQVAQKKAKASQFLRDVVWDDDKAADFDYMSVEDYAEKKHIQIVNTGRSSLMTNKNGRTKQDLLDQVDALTETRFPLWLQLKSTHSSKRKA
jgi:hypothetical protein